MAENTKYYTLAASLPYLPPIDVAERLPISGDTLKDRLKMLSDEDRETLKQASKFMRWQNHRLGQSDEEILALFGEMLRLPLQSKIHAMVEFVLNHRLVMTALRLRLKGFGPEALDKYPGSYRLHMQQNWKDANFKLDTVYAWLPSSREKLERAQTFALEKESMQIVWNGLSRIVENKEFNFSFIFAYCSKWDILQSWLEYKAEAAKKILEQLMTSITHDYETKLGN